MIGSGSGTGPLDYESRDPIPDPETLPFKYSFGQLSFYHKKTTKKTTTTEKHGSLVVSAHTGIRCQNVGFDPRGRRGNILVSEHAFLSVICRDDTK